MKNLYFIRVTERDSSANASPASPFGETEGGQNDSFWTGSASRKVSCKSLLVDLAILRQGYGRAVVGLALRFTPRTAGLRCDIAGKFRVNVGPALVFRWYCGGIALVLRWLRAGVEF